MHYTLYSHEYPLLQTAFDSIPNDDRIDCLDLSFNRLSFRETEELISAFPTIPENIHMLNLSWNSLYQKSIEDLALIFIRMPRHIDTIQLDNQLIFARQENNGAFLTTDPNTGEETNIHTYHQQLKARQVNAPHITLFNAEAKEEIASTVQNPMFKAL